MEGLCGLCGATVAAGFRFCGACGAPHAVVPCTSCGGINPVSHRHCGHCGRALPASTLLPPPASVAPAADERKLASVLFADVVGFTTIAEHADPEEVARRVDAAFRRFVAIVVDHGGRVDKYLGDGLMALFGVPQAHEDDAERAIAAALAMLGQAGAGPDPELRFSIGINTGEVMVTSLGGDGAQTVIGDAVNVAARLEKLAAPGQILVGGTTAALARARLQLVRRAPVVVKGRAKPVEVWEAVGFQAQTWARRRRGPELIGRDADLAYLVGAWRRAVDDRRPGVVLVTGEPGIGKTRLVEALIDHVRRDRATGSAPRIVHAAYPAYGGLGGAKVGAEIARQLGPSADPEVERRLQAEGEQDASLPTDDVEAMFVEQVWAYRRLAEERATERPLLVVLDDVHRSNDRLTELLGRVNARIAALPILTVLAGRHDPSAWLTAFPSATTLRVGPLGPVPSAQLARSVAPDLDLQALSIVAERAAGNPLFVRELAPLAALAADPGSLPPTLHSILAARLDALAPDAKAVLQLVAVLGGGVSVAQVASLATDRPAWQVARAVADLLEAGLLSADEDGRADGGPRLTLADSLLAEVAYAAMPRQVRGEHHRRAAEVVPTLAQRARHLEKAARFLDGEAARSAAVTALVAAGREARDLTRLPEAIRLLSSAASLGTGPEELLELAQLQCDAGHSSDAAATLARLPPTGSLTIEQQAGAEHLEALLGMAADPAGSVRRLTSALATWQQVGRAPKAAWALANRGMANLAGGERAAAAADLDQAAALFHDLGDPVGELAAVRALQLIRPDDPQAQEWLRRALEQAVASGNRTAQSSALSGMVWYRFLRDRFGSLEATAAVREQAAQLSDLAGELGLCTDEVDAHSLGSLLARWSGDLEAAGVLAVEGRGVEEVRSGEHVLALAAAAVAGLARDPRTALPVLETGSDTLANAAAYFVVEGLLAADRAQDVAGWFHPSPGSLELGELGDMAISLSTGWAALCHGAPDQAVEPLVRVGLLARRLGWGPGGAVAAALLVHARWATGEKDLAEAAALAAVGHGRHAAGGFAGLAVASARCLVGDTTVKPAALQALAEAMGAPVFAPGGTLGSHLSWRRAAAAPTLRTDAIVETA